MRRCCASGCAVMSRKKESGEKYPATTLRQILAAFQRMLRSNKVPLNIFDKHDLRFSELRNTLDTVSVSLRKQGIGAEVCHAAVISLEDENLIWESGVVGFEPPEALLRAVFVTVGMHFSLRGGQEHYELKVEQFKRFPLDGYSTETHYVYTENGSKNYQGRFSECGQSNKIVRAFSQPESNRCPVRVLDAYLSKLPENPPAFYLQWLSKVPDDATRPWYKRMRIGINPLKKMMTTISQHASCQCGIQITVSGLQLLHVCSFQEFQRRL